MMSKTWQCSLVTSNTQTTMAIYQSLVSNSLSRKAVCLSSKVKYTRSLSCSLARSWAHQARESTSCFSTTLTSQSSSRIWSWVWCWWGRHILTVIVTLKPHLYQQLVVLLCVQLLDLKSKDREAL